MKRLSVARKSSVDKEADNLYGPGGQTHEQASICPEQDGLAGVTLLDDKGPSVVYPHVIEGRSRISSLRWEKSHLLM